MGCIQDPFTGELHYTRGEGWNYHYRMSVNAVLALRHGYFPVQRVARAYKCSEAALLNACRHEWHHIGDPHEEEGPEPAAFVSLKDAKAWRAAGKPKVWWLKVEFKDCEPKVSVTTKWEKGVQRLPANPRDVDEVEIRELQLLYHEDGKLQELGWHVLAALVTHYKSAEIGDYDYSVDVDEDCDDLGYELYHSPKYDKRDAANAYLKARAAIRRVLAKGK
jgi:hypothetical protein